MVPVLPDTLFGRTAGFPLLRVPLRIDPDHVQSTCGFCGQPAVLQRRLRKAEPEVPGAPLRLYLGVSAVDADPAAGRGGWSRAWPAAPGEKEPR